MISEIGNAIGYFLNAIWQFLCNNGITFRDGRFLPLAAFIIFPLACSLLFAVLKALFDFGGE